MTVEQRTFIAPSDIAGIEYECEHCHSRHLVPIAKFDRVLGRCPNCQQELIRTLHADSSKPSDAAALHAFVVALTDIQNRGLVLRLEILGAAEIR